MERNLESDIEVLALNPQRLSMPNDPAKIEVYINWVLNMKI